MSNPESPSLVFVQQALNDFAGSMAPSVRSAFVVVARQHFGEVESAVASVPKLGETIKTLRSEIEMLNGQLAELKGIEQSDVALQPE